ncbi:hypothetical protein KEM52_005277 [Ascosphaera acerosa]|nr:hypothetical protein KEM52_005277 [Ascosphaera acerosa]
MVHHSLLARRNPNNAPLPGEPGPRHNKQPTSPWMDSDSDESSAFDRRESTRSRPHSFGRPESGSNTTSLQRHPSNAGRQMPPTLEQVLSDQAPPPYTRGAFTAYLSQNHCLESLEFYIDANKYEHDYNIVAKQLGTTVLDRRCPQTEHLCQLWQRLLTIYMYPGAAREINVAGDVRDDLLKYAHASIPPHPRTLSSAVNRIYELMEESIFIPFINSLPAPLPQPLGLPAGPRDDYYPYDRPNMTHLSLRRRFPAQPPSLAVSSSQSSTASPLGGDSLSNSPAPGSILSLTSLSSVQPMSTVNSELTSLHDSTYGNSDTLSMTSPADAEMMTPPTTPPIVEGQSQCPALSGLGALPPCPKQRENPWKKMGLRLGFKKKTSGTPISPKESAFEQQHAAATD